MLSETQALLWLCRQAADAFASSFVVDRRGKPRYSTPLFGSVSALSWGFPVTSAVPTVVMVHKVSGVLISKGKMVLLKRQAPSLRGDGGMDTWWEVPGGKPNFNGEPIKQVVTREMAEEIGATVSVKGCLGVATHPKFQDQVIAYFLCDCKDDEKVRNMCPGEHVDTGCFTPKELEELIKTDEVRVPSEIVSDFIRHGTVTLRPPILPFGLPTLPVLG